ncbi:hypothetical protein D3C85_1526700 [compost metagenome]
MLGSSNTIIIILSGNFQLNRPGIQSPLVLVYVPLTFRSAPTLNRNKLVSSLLTESDLRGDDLLYNKRNWITYVLEEFL